MLQQWENCFFCTLQIYNSLHLFEMGNSLVWFVDARDITIQVVMRNLPIFKCPRKSSSLTIVVNGK